MIRLYLTRLNRECHQTYYSSNTLKYSILQNPMCKVAAMFSISTIFTLISYLIVDHILIWCNLNKLAILLQCQSRFFVIVNLACWGAFAHSQLWSPWVSYANESAFIINAIRRCLKLMFLPYTYWNNVEFRILVFASPSANILGFFDSIFDSHTLTLRMYSRFIFRAGPLSILVSCYGTDHKRTDTTIFSTFTDLIVSLF